MSSPAKAAGTRWETEVVRYLRAWWAEVDRRPLSGRYDKGDIKYGPAGWTVECKNQQRLNLPLFLRQAKTEAANNGTGRYVVIVRNRRSKFSSGATADAFAVMPLHAWADTVKELELLRVAVEDEPGLVAISAIYDPK